MSWELNADLVDLGRVGEDGWVALVIHLRRLMVFGEPPLQQAQGFLEQDIEETGCLAPVVWRLKASIWVTKSRARLEARMTCCTCPWARLSGTRSGNAKSENPIIAVRQLLNSMGHTAGQCGDGRHFFLPDATAPRDVLLGEVGGQHLNGWVAVEHDGAGDQFHVDRGAIRSRALPLD